MSVSFICAEYDLYYLCYLYLSGLSFDCQIGMETLGSRSSAVVAVGNIAHRSLEFGCSSCLRRRERCCASGWSKENVLLHFELCFFFWFFGIVFGFLKFLVGNRFDFEDSYAARAWFGHHRSKGSPCWIEDRMAGVDEHCPHSCCYCPWIAGCSSRSTTGPSSPSSCSPWTSNSIKVACSLSCWSAAAAYSIGRLSFALWCTGPPSSRWGHGCSSIRYRFQPFDPFAIASVVWAEDDCPVVASGLSNSVHLLLLVFNLVIISLIIVHNSRRDSGWIGCPCDPSWIAWTARPVRAWRSCPGPGWWTRERLLQRHPVCLAGKLGWRHCTTAYRRRSGCWQIGWTSLLAMRCAFRRFGLQSADWATVAAALDFAGSVLEFGPKPGQLFGFDSTELSKFDLVVHSCFASSTGWWRRQSGKFYRLGRPSIQCSYSDRLMVAGSNR